ncbi:MAG TPA: hypothetical protein VIC08_00025, partial [Cellvibrionaceae bacterium]
KQRLRLQRALLQRQQLFRHMVVTFPPGFLPPELNSLVYRTLIATCEQLAGLEPQKPHAQEAAQYSKQLAETTAAASRPRLESEQQAAEVNTLLQELMRALITWSERGQIGKPQAAKLAAHIRRLLLQVTIDSHLQQAKTCRAEKRLKLAIHHYNLARQALLKESAQQNVQKQIEQISAAITQLESEVANADTQVTSTVEDNKDQKAWEELEETDSWKKKQIYD